MLLTSKLNIKKKEQDLNYNEMYIIAYRFCRIKKPEKVFLEFRKLSRHSATYDS